MFYDVCSLESAGQSFISSMNKNLTFELRQHTDIKQYFIQEKHSCVWHLDTLKCDCFVFVIQSKSLPLTFSAKVLFMIHVESDMTAS